MYIEAEQDNSFKITKPQHSDSKVTCNTSISLFMIAPL